MCCLQLTQILKDEVCVHNYAQFGACQEKAGDKSPNLGRELEDLEVVEVEPPEGKNSKVTANRGRKDSTSQSPAKSIILDLTVAVAKGLLSGCCLPCQRRRAPVGVHDFGHGGRRKGKTGTVKKSFRVA